MSKSGRASTSKARGALLDAGVVGGALSMLAALALFLWPGTLAGAAIAAADFLILLGLAGLGSHLDRTGGLGAIACMLANIVATLSSVALPLVGVGPVFDLFGGLSWLADALAYGNLARILLFRRTDLRRDIRTVVGATTLLRGIAALMLGVFQPAQAVLGLPHLFLVHLWQVFAVVAGLALAILFLAAKATN